MSNWVYDNGTFSHEDLDTLEDVLVSSDYEDIEKAVHVLMGEEQEITVTRGDIFNLIDATLIAFVYNF